MNIVAGRVGLNNALTFSSSSSQGENEERGHGHNERARTIEVSKHASSIHFVVIP
jgi:hypothetical protein